MTEPQPDLTLHKPWLVAVWPGMGSVALAAGSYLVGTLDPTPLVQVDAKQHFDISGARISEGVVQAPRFSHNQFYGWKAPPGGRDLLIFVGQQQPVFAAYDFCVQLLQVAKRYGVERVVTFASLVTALHPAKPLSVFAVATNRSLLEDVRAAGEGIETMTGGEIGGLNGTLLAAALEQGLEGACLLGEVPTVARQIPYLKASLAVLEVFSTLAGLELDFDELARQAKLVEERLVALVDRIEQLSTDQRGEHPPPLKLELNGGKGEEKAPEEPPSGTATLDPGALAQIESLFLAAERDTALALELKDALDRFGVFTEYENRFLDLFSPDDLDAA